MSQLAPKIYTFDSIQLVNLFQMSSPQVPRTHTQAPKLTAPQFRYFKARHIILPIQLSILMVRRMQ